MQFTFGIKRFCSPSARVKVKVYDTDKSVLVIIKKFSRLPERFPYTFAVTQDYLVLRILIDEVNYEFMS